MSEHTVGEFRAMYLKQIEVRKKEIAELEQKLKMIEVFTADADFIFEPKDKYKNWTLTPAVVDAIISLHEIGVINPDGVEAYDIHKYLVEHGIKVTENFTISLHVTLKRLSDKNDGRLMMTKDKAFKKLYKLGKSISPQAISARSLKMLDKSVASLKKGPVSAPIDLPVRSSIKKF